MDDRYWENSGEKCPVCGEETQKLIELRQEDWDDKPEEYALAERCSNCDWRVDF